MSYVNVEINGINLLDSYRAVLVEQHSIQPPVPKMFFQEVPGADGTADLSTSVAGRMTYNRRKITLNFQSEHTENRWTTILSELLREFHGKGGKLVFEDDQNYYYFGRMEVNGYERTRTYGKFTIIMDAEPYKYEKLSSLEPWPWGPFNLRAGVIRNYGNLVVEGSKVLSIKGTERWVIPVFVVEGKISVCYEGKEYELRPGKNKIYAIAIKPGMNELIFKGDGVVSVDYRGGIL